MHQFSRLKHDPRAPILALTHALERFDMTIDDVEAIALGMPPGQPLKGLLACGIVPLVKALTPVAAGLLGDVGRYAADRLRNQKFLAQGFEWLPRHKTTAIAHHLAHGASAYRTGPFDEALSISMDAAGTDSEGRFWSGAVYRCHSGEMELLEMVPRYASLGCFFNAVTQSVGFRPVGEDWKLMGLAAFGDPEVCYGEMANLAPRWAAGRWICNVHTVEAKMIDRPRFLRQTRLWQSLVRMIDRYGDRNVAAAAQKRVEDVTLAYVRSLVERTGCRNLALSGGFFHNIKVCMRLHTEISGVRTHVHPAAGDVGTALGAALELHHRRTGDSGRTPLSSMALGASFCEDEQEGELVRHRSLVSWERPADLAASVADLLAARQVVGVFEGRAEWGPRALGQRSVLADPSDPTMRDRINGGLKNREWFMPFAPSILEEAAERYLEDYHYAPFMTHAFRVTDKGRQDLSSAVHLDGTVRAQIVRKDVLPHYHGIISAFQQRTGIGGVLNTSFNRHGQPVVNSPLDAVRHLLWGCIDVLALGPFLVRRRAAPIPFRNRIDWTTDQIIGKWEDFTPHQLEIRRRRAMADADGPAAVEQIAR